MSRTWLLLDTSFLAYRAFHSTGNLSFEGVGTGVLYGLLRDIITLQETFSTRNFAFCFDSPGKKLKRQEIYPAYKANRKAPKSEDDAKLLGELRRQINLLRDDYLPGLGYKNVLFADGYEADDVIASVCQKLPVGPCSNCNGMGVAKDDFTGSKKADCRCCNGTGGNYDSAVIVSSDKDLWQLLSPNVSMWNPRAKKMMTEKSFTEEWKLSPADWPYVKAVAGCDGDNVAGIKGVGEKTAAKYWRLELGEKSKALRAIETDEGLAIADDNFKLVKLPFPGTPIFQLREDSVSKKDWDKLVGRLGMRSLVGKG